MYWPFKATKPSESEIFFVIVHCLYVLAFQGNNILPKWNILCYCRLLVCIGLLEWHTLPKWNILCYCRLFICIDLFKATTSSQSEIFSVIVACSYVLTFQGHNTLPKWNSFSKLLLEVQYFLKYFFKAVIVPWCLFICMYWPFNTSTPSQSEIFFQIFFVIVVIGCPIFSEIFF